MRLRVHEVTESYATLSRALGIDPARALPTIAEVVARCGWGHRAIEQPLLPSGVRHGAPWGLSMVLGAGAPEARLFLEPQAEPVSAASYWRAGRALTAWIATQPGADTRAFEAVAERFVPDDRSRFRIWHTVAFSPNEPARYRVYLCANGAERTLAPLDERPGDLSTIVSLDLHREGRVKRYRLRQCRAADAVPPELADDARRLAAAMLDDPERVLGWLTCVAFRNGAEPVTALHLSCLRHVDEGTVADRITTLAHQLSIDPAPYHAALAALRPRHHFVSLQRWAGAPRLTIYFLPEVAR